MFRKIYTILKFMRRGVNGIIVLTILLTTLTGCSSERLPTLAELPGPYGSLVVEVYGFRTLQGALLFSLFRAEDGFPDDSSRALVNLFIPVKSGRIVFTLPPLPIGLYSYSLLHDENDNGKMDRSLLGTPLDGYALSNDLEGHFGLPKATAALFELTAKPQRHELRIRYFKRKDKGARPF